VVSVRRLLDNYLCYVLDYCTKFGFADTAAVVGDWLRSGSMFNASVSLSGRELQRIEQKIREKQVKVSQIKL